MLAGMMATNGLVAQDNSLEMAVRHKTFIRPKMFRL